MLVITRRCGHLMSLSNPPAMTHPGLAFSLVISQAKRQLQWLVGELRQPQKRQEAIAAMTIQLCSFDTRPEHGGNGNRRV